MVSLPTRPGEIRLGRDHHWWRGKETVK